MVYNQKHNTGGSEGVPVKVRATHRENSISHLANHVDRATVPSMRITAIYDNGGKSLDRYTVVTDAAWSPSLIAALGLSTDPEAFNGFSQWTGAHDGPHLGQRIQFETLPARLQRHIAARVFGEER